MSSDRANPGRGSKGEAPGFEESLEQLEAIIERIEGGEIGLEKSIAEYEHGMELIKRCRAILEKAEQKVEELSKAADGSDADGKGGTNR